MGKKSKNQPGKLTHSINVDETYKQAVDHFNAGNFVEADRLCTAIIQAYPNNIDAINLLGVIAQNINRHDVAIGLFQTAINIDANIWMLHNNLGISLNQTGRGEDAIIALNRALQIEPGNSQTIKHLQNIVDKSRGDTLQEMLQRGITLHHDGNLDEAIEWYKKTIKSDPLNVVAKTNLAIAFHALGRLQDAIASYNAVLAIKPDNADVHFNLGNIFKDLGQFTDAISSYKNAVIYNPEFAEAYSNLAIVYNEQGRAKKAVENYQKAIAINPNFATAYYNLGNLQKELGELDDAVANYKKAVAIKPDFAIAQSNLAYLLTKLGKLDEAESTLHKLIAINPDYLKGYYNLGDVYDKQMKLDAAVACYQKVIAIKNDHYEAHYNLGVVLEKQMQLEAAAASYQQTIALKADYAKAHCNLGNVFLKQGNLTAAINSYNKTVAIKPDDAKTQSNILLCSQYIPSQTLQNLLSIHKKCAKKLITNCKPEIFEHTNNRSPSRKLRVGFVSGDLGYHPVGYFMAGFFKHHPCQELEIFCYSDYEPDDLTQKLKSYSKGWVETKGMEDEQLAKRIHADGIDILIDLSGHTAVNRLLVFLKKPAPIQISWAGYVGTTGLPTMDWLIADKHYVADGEEKFYTEGIIKMPDSWVSYTPPKNIPKIKKKTSERFVMGNFGNSVKINEKMLETWAHILQKAQNSNLLLIYKGMDSKFNVNRINSYFNKAGIDTDRISIKGQILHKELLATYNTIDIALDTLPYSGGLTTIEALYMGVPVITNRGATFAGRHATSILNAVGLKELICNSFDEYIELVVALSQNPNKLKKIKKNLHTKIVNSPICDHKKFSTDLSKELRKVWQIWCANNGG
ncbi:MAG: tetratricopeptide repeat protein [Magnetococcales bacterium]|nr:tetratricopeptide repeat protein [Magnetococcales bacterium]